MSIDIALQYYDDGLMPIPLHEKQALVKWTAYQAERPSRQLVELWFTQFSNSRIGIITGPVSDLLVLDVDGEEGMQQVKCQEIPDTWTVKTPRGGYHYYFKYPNELKDVKTTLAGILPSVDVRGDGGYVVGVNGHKDYSWVTKPWDTELKEAPQWLKTLLISKASSNKQSTKPEQNHWLSDLLKGVGEGGRHEALVKLASYYFSRMPADVASQLIRDWNEKNSPPIDEDELEQQLVDLASRFKSGEYASSFKEEITDEDEEVFGVGDVLKDVSEPSWLVDPYIPKSGLVILSGEPEVGKTWFALDLAIELTRGGKWLCEFPTKQAKVLYIDEERPKEFFKKRMRLLTTAKEYTPSRDMLKFSFQKGMKLDRDRGTMLFTKLLEKHQPDVVILDAFADFLTGKENDVTDILKIYDFLKFLRKKHGTTFVIIDHEKKAQLDRSGKLVINEAYVGNDVRGSSAKRAVVETQLSFKMVDGHIKVFHSKASWSMRNRPFMASIDDIVKGEAAIVQFKGYV